MAQKNKVTVRIAGNEYVLCGDESPEYIQKVALFVDKKLQEITRKNHLLSTSMASVLASVNMAEELFQLKEVLNDRERELKELKRKHQELIDEHQRLKNENSRLKERESQLQIELTKKETEVREVRNTLKLYQTPEK